MCYVYDPEMSLSRNIRRFVWLIQGGYKPRVRHISSCEDCAIKNTKNLYPL